MAYDRIHIWGDSIGKGVVFDEGRRRYCITPARCLAQYEQSTGVTVKNHCRMGATLPEGLADFLDTDADAGIPVVIEYGGNDCDMPWKDIADDPDIAFEGRVPLADFAEGLRAFVAAVRARGMLPLLVTPPPLDAQRYFGWVTRGLAGERVLRFLGDVPHIYRWQERYATAIHAVARSLDCALFDMRAVLLDERRYPDLVCVDGIHLNAQGHTVVAEAILSQRGGLAQALAARA